MHNFKKNSFLQQIRETTSGENYKKYIMKCSKCGISLFNFQRSFAFQ